MPKSKNVQYTNKEKVIQERCGGDEAMRVYLMRHINQGIADLRKICALTPEDWALYEECKAYEFLANRDEEDCVEDDTEKNMAFGKKGVWWLLAKPLFKQLKEESDSKKLTHDMYLSLRFRDTHYDRRD
jgi:hypothetical protein